MAANVMRTCTHIHPQDIKPANIFIGKRSRRSRQRVELLPPSAPTTPPPSASHDTLPLQLAGVAAAAAAAAAVRLESTVRHSNQAAPVAPVARSGSVQAVVASSPAGSSNGAAVSAAGASVLHSDMVFKLGDYGTMREEGRQHLSYFVTGFGCVGACVREHLGDCKLCACGHACDTRRALQYL
jgi:hypothetical protein